MNLWSSFSSSSVKEWESKIKKDLKVSSIEDLNWKTSYGSINPIAKTNSQLSIHKTSKLNEICWRFDNENCSNNEILNHLSNGVNSININSQKFKESLFKNVMNDIIYNNIIVDHSLNEYDLAQWTDWINSNNLKGTLRIDPFSCIFKNTYKENLDYNINLIKLAHKTIDKNSFKCLYLDGSIYGDLLYDSDVELAHITAQLNEIIECYNSASIQVPDKLVIKVSLSADFMQEAAKIRALKAVVFQILKVHNLNLELQIECDYKETLLSPVNKEINLLRITTAFIVAIISKVNSIELKDSMCIHEGDYWKKILTNIPLILLEESLLNINEDVISGAHLFEQICSKMAQKSWEHFQSIEKMGGFLNYSSKGKLTEIIEKQQNKKLNYIKNNDHKIVGFNCFNENNEDLNFGIEPKLPFSLKDFA